MAGYTFERAEQKYIISSKKKQALLNCIRDHIVPDSYGRTTVQSIYLDTKDMRLIRASIDAEVYKEKLRLRSYGVPSDRDTVFLELKKKYRGIVYKRRECMSLVEARRYVFNGIIPKDTQIMREIEYSMELYGRPKPSVLISCEREAYYETTNEDIRITFDTDLRFRTHDLLLEKGSTGTRIFNDGSCVLEIKVPASMPLWLDRALQRLFIYPSSFSKYKEAYRKILIEGLSEPLKGDKYVINF